jgi:[protein-PII] uridylyltransferase
VAGSAIDTFRVVPHFGAPPAAELLRQQLGLALSGGLNVLDELARKERDATEGRRQDRTRAAVPINTPSAPPRILWHPGTGDQLVVEVRSADATGLLAVLTSVFERAGVDVAWAKVTTLGSTVIDVFAVTLPADADGAMQQRLEAELYAVLPAPPVVKAAS